MSDKVRYGIIGTGRIVHRFMAGFEKVPEAELVAVYGRNLEKAQKIARRYGAHYFFDSLDDFIACDEIDIVYIAVTHPHHSYFAIQAMQAGKAVLCEKPLAPCYSQAVEMVECARKNKVFLMEAMWTRLFPVTKQVNEWIDAGKIGRLVAVDGTFCFKAPREEGDRMFDPKEAGGALLDIGVYLVSYMHMLFKRPPEKIVSCAHKSEAGVDETAGAVFQYDKGAMATLLFSFQTDAKDTVRIYGSDGMIEVYEDFWRPTRAVLSTKDGTLAFDCPVEGEGYQYEVAHVNDCVKLGLMQSPYMTQQHSLEIIKTCDDLRQIWGIRFDFEKR
ncbi:MAG: Gfo/Idh/MocA family protein [Christensenellales bacterium]